MVCQPYTITNVPNDLNKKCAKYFERVDFKANQLALANQSMSVGELAGVFPYLSRLNLKWVNITDLNTNTFSGMDQLSHIEIISSELEEIKAGTLDHAIALKSIDLTGTKLVRHKYILIPYCSAFLNKIVWVIKTISLQYIYLDTLPIHGHFAMHWTSKDLRKRI